LGVDRRHIAVQVHLIRIPPRKYTFDTCAATMRALRANPNAHHFEADVCFEEAESCTRAIVLLGARRGEGAYAVDGEPLCHEAWGSSNKKFATVMYTNISGDKGATSTFRKNHLLPAREQGNREVIDLWYDSGWWIDGWRNIVESIGRVVNTRAQNRAGWGKRIRCGPGSKSRHSRAGTAAWPDEDGERG
jgi:hypothetical protein